MASTIDRRQFAGVVTGAALAFSSPVSAASPNAVFPTEPRERLSVSTYPFRAVIKPTPGAHMTLQDFAATIPEKFNVSGIEPWSDQFDSIEPEYVHRLAAAFKKAGVRVVNIPCDVDVQLCGTSEHLMTALDTYSKWVDAAVILGSPSIRVHVPKSDPLTDIRCAVDSLKALADYGEKQNIVINLENDDATTEDPYRVLKVIEKANTPYLRALPDFGNSRQLGDERYNEQALRALFPHAYNISHVKDMETINGKVLKSDMAAIFTIAKQAGYKGYFSMEWDAEGADPYQATRRLIAASLKGLN